MKKFNFRLQTVLKLRRQHEEEKKRVVGSLVAEINTLQREALEIGETVREQGVFLRERIQDRVDVNWIANYHGYVTYLQQSISEKIKAVAEVQQKLGPARGELTEAARQRKVLEKLKERQSERFNKRLKKMELREMDEIGTNVFLRSDKRVKQESMQG